MRDEIDAVELVARAEGVGVERLGPPDEAMMSDVRGIERGVIACAMGEALDVGEGDRAGGAGENDGGEAAGDVGEGGGGERASEGGEGDGGEAGSVGEDDRVGEADGTDLPTTTLRMSVSPEIARFWKSLEAMCGAREPSESFVAFLVRAVMRAWAGAIRVVDGYRDVYLRERWRCASPVCRSRNVSPHHVIFRSRGGGEERGNLVALCEICRLDLVHQGRLTVVGTAPDGLAWRATGWAA